LRTVVQQTFVRGSKHAIWNSNTSISATILQTRCIIYGCIKRVLCSIKGVISDDGNMGELADEVKIKFGYIVKVIRRQDGTTKDFKSVIKRWVIEGIFSWFDNDRMLLKKLRISF